MDTEMKETIPNWKPLKEYTDEELFEFLKGNEKQTTHVLAGICSEILRRQLMRSFSEDSSTSSN